MASTWKFTVVSFGAAIVLASVGVSAQSADVLKQIKAELPQAKELDYRHTIASSRELKKGEREQLMRLADKELRPDAADPEIKSEAQIQQAEGQTRIKLIDLNGDGLADVVLQPTGNDYCGAVGNCGLLVFEKTASGYRKLLDREGIQGMAVEASSTAGYHVLFLTAHSSATETMIYLYGYRSGKYRQTGCFVADWNPPGKPDVILKSPIITKCSRAAAS